MEGILWHTEEFHIYPVGIENHSGQNVFTFSILETLLQ